MSDKNKKIGFWILTGLVCLSQGASGVLDLMQNQGLVDAMKGLGYPAYLLYILGVCKLGGAITLAAPGATLKEWAYAGFFFDFMGAAASHALSGDGTSPTSCRRLCSAPFSWARTRFVRPIAGARRCRSKSDYEKPRPAYCGGRNLAFR